MNCTSLHHIEMCLSNSAQAFNFFTSRLGFRLVAVRDTSTCSQKVLRQQNIILVLTQRKEGHCNGNEENTCNNGVHFKSDILTNTENEMSNGSQDVHAPKCPEIGKVIESDGVQRNEGRHSNGRHVTTPKRHANTHEEHFTVFCCRNNSQHTIDSVFNAAVVVTNVHEVTERVKKMGGEVIRNPTVVSDDLGQVTYSIIATGFGNSVHTLIDKTKYTGKFLPGFTKYESEELEPTVVSNEDLYFPLTTHMDHIAYVCEEGQSQAFIRWYEQVFCMKRFLVNREENLDTGLAIEGTVGLRLRALEYWRCSETGLYIPSHGDTSLKIVVAEPITSIQPNHVSQFLVHHKGPGLQHVAFHAPHLLQTVAFLSKKGVPFRKPPSEYYLHGGKRKELEQLGLGKEAELLQEAGVLLDTEADPAGPDNKDVEDRYLLQIFSEPLFGPYSFFLELIHRAGALGFGVGNITALAHSITLHQ